METKLTRSLWRSDVGQKICWIFLLLPFTVSGVGVVVIDSPKVGFCSGQQTSGRNPVKLQTDFLRYPITSSGIGFLSRESTLPHCLNPTHLPCLLCGVVQLLSSSSTSPPKNDIWEVATLSRHRNTVSLSMLLLHRTVVTDDYFWLPGWCLVTVLSCGQMYIQLAGHAATPLL